MFSLKFITDSRKGITLVELLAVMSIISLLGAICIPAIGSSTRGLYLNYASTTLAQTLDNARIAAQARNRPVELRFYVRKSGTLNVSSVQLYWIDDDGTTLAAADKKRNFPENIGFYTANKGSSLLESLTELTDSKNQPYRSFRFRPDGSADLLVGENVLTLINEVDIIATNGALPANFASLQVDPLTGRARLFRP